MRTGSAALVAMIVMSMPNAARSADDLREELRRTAADGRVGDLAQGLIGFTALPGISAANFRIDPSQERASHVDLTKFVLPLSHDFQDTRIGGLPLYGELTLGYLTADQTVGDLFEDSVLATGVESDFAAYSAVGGVGLTIPLGATTTIRPILLAGYSHLDEHSDFAGLGRDIVDKLTNGYLFNLHVNIALVGAALAIEHRQDLPGDLRLTGSARYNQLFADTFAASDDILETSGSFGVFTAALQLDGPLPAKLFDHELRWIGFVTNSSFPGHQSRALGFDYFFELGGGIELVDAALPAGITGLSLRGSALAGDGVTGWSVGLAMEF